MIRKLRILALAAAAAATSVSCNIFDPFDAPSGDAQLISAARACFDRGDLVCARENYEKLSADNSDIKISEKVFAVLDEQGASMGAFMEAFGGGGGGPGITKIADKFLAHATPPSSTKREALMAAYLQAIAISNVNLRGLARFVAATALLAEVLAEDAGTDGRLNTTDIAASAAACKAATAVTCAAQCTAKAGGLITATGSAFDLDSVTSISLTLHAVNAIISKMDLALGTEIKASGSFQGGAGSFASSLAASAVAGTDCYRQQLLIQEIGG